MLSVHIIGSLQEWKWQEMHRQVPDVESYLVETQTHAFCVSTEQSREQAACTLPAHVQAHTA